MARTVVLGIGNTLLCDEGAGVHLLEYLRARHPDIPDLEYVDGGTLSFTLAEVVEGADKLIVLDAAELGSEPGTICCLVDEEMDRFLGSSKRSAHEVGLLDLLAIAHLSARLPRQRALVGIQPAQMGWGEKPSEPVEQAFPEAAECVLKLLADWRCR